MLRTLVAALVVEMAMLVVLYAAKLPGPALLKWYRQLGLSAFAMDVLSAYVCVYLARSLEQPLLVQALAAVGIQMAHDVAFGSLLTRLPRGASKVVDLFKDYARPAILGYDAAIVLSVLAVDRVLERNTPPLQLLGAVAAYVGIFLVHSF